MKAGDTTEPQISVIVPFYMGLDELELTLAGLDKQSPETPPFEVIVAEDGSPVSSRRLARTFDRLRVRFVRIERDGFRLATARNAALVQARSIVLMLDFDCVPGPRHVIAHVSTLKSNRSFVTVGLRRFVDARKFSRDVIEVGRSWWVGLDDIESISNPGWVADKRTGIIERISEIPYPCNLFHGCNVGFWHAAAMDVGMFDERFNGAHGYEDIEFAYRLQRRGAAFVFVDGPVFHVENQIVDVETRRLGRKRNLALLGQLCPDLVAHRREIERIKL